MVKHLGSVQIVMKCSNVPYIYDRLMLMVYYTDGREGVVDEAGGKSTTSRGRHQTS